MLVTHDAELASLADTRLVLRDGRPVTPDDALRNAGQSHGGGSAMTFVLRMALREIRASWQRLLFFFVCIAVGVASIVAIRSVIQSVREGLTREARAMTGADVVVRSDRPLGEQGAVVSGAGTRERPRRDRVGGDRDRHDGPARRTRRRRGWSSCAPSGGVSALRDDDAARGAVLARAAAGTTARWSGPSCWRSSICASATTC